MSKIMAAFYDLVMAAPEQACLGPWRKELLQALEGRILEIGSGTGVNAPYYPANVEHVTFTEPDPDMRIRLEQKLKAADLPYSWGVEPIEAETLPFDDGSFDAAVSTLVLCTVHDPAASLAEIKRVLKPDGRLVFLEHVAADEGSGRFKWQQRLEPMWKVCAGNCHITRRTAESIQAAGFRIEDIKRDSMRKSIGIVRPTIRGVARITK